MNFPARTKAESAGLKRPKMPLRIQINSETPSRMSERKADTCRSAATPVIPGLKSCMSKNNNHIRNISDYFNSRQINDAIAAADSFSDRLKVVDFILKRRLEFKNAENKVKLERAAPILKNFRQNMKSKLQNGKFNKFRVAVKDVDGADHRLDVGSKIESSILSNEESSSTLTKLNTRSTLKKQKTKSLEPRGRLPSIELTTPQDNHDGDRNKMPKPVPSSRRLSFQVDQPFTLNLENAGNPFLTHREGSLASFVQDNKRASIQPIFSRNQIIEKFADMMNGKSKTEGKNTPKQKPKALIKPVPIKRVVSKSVQDEANKKLEQDLFNYLSRYGPQERQIIQGLDSHGPVKIKAIEAKALAKFKSTRDPSSPEIKSHRVFTKAASEVTEYKPHGKTKRVTLQLPNEEQGVESAR